MKPGDILLTALPQRDGTTKDRPALYLRAMPPFQDFLVCGVSTQLQQAVPMLTKLADFLRPTSTP